MRDGEMMREGGRLADWGGEGKGWACFCFGRVECEVSVALWCPEGWQ